IRDLLPCVPRAAECQAARASCSASQSLPAKPILLSPSIPLTTPKTKKSFVLFVSLWFSLLLTLPAPSLQQFTLAQFADLDTAHGFAQFDARLEQHLGIFVMCYSLHNGAGTNSRILGFEDPGADKDRLCAQLHAERSVCRCCHAARSKVGDRQSAVSRNHQNQ